LAFARITALSTITIPSSVTMLGAKCFSSCSALATVIFEGGSHISRIEPFAFFLRSSLISICIPGSVEVVGDNCFRHCTGFSTLLSENAGKLRIIGRSAF
jgi:hypothetical protein